MNIKYRALLLLTCCLSAVVLHAKVVKPISVAHGQPYTDHIALAKDATDKDIMVKFQFNEDDNTLTVSVISYRTLFVFWDDTRYKTAIKRRWIHTDMLPYIVTSDEGQRFRLSKPLKKALPKPYKEFIFKKWLTYSGLQPQEQEVKMVNSYIEQTFDIQNKRNHAKIHLHDIMLLDLTKQNSTSSVYEVSFGKDLDTEYQITIQRNPCFGLDQEVESAQKSLEAIKKSYDSFKKKYAKGTVGSEEGKKAFDELKATLTAQYQHNSDSSACPVIQDCIAQYNQVVDSLSAVNVTYASPAEVTNKVMGGKISEVNEKVVLTNARAIDSKVARWLNSRDELERADIIRDCQNIINDTKLMLKSLPDSKRSEAIFRQAEQYFIRTCK